MGYGNGVTTSGAYPSDVATAPKLPLVAMELERQAKAIEHLHSLLGDLESRISAVLRPSAPTPLGNQQAGPPVNAHPVALATGLYDQNVRLEGACARVQSMYERIEL